MNYNVKANDKDVEIEEFDSDLNGGWNAGYDAYIYAKKICVNKSDKVDIDIFITDQNSKLVENVTIFIGNEDTILKSNAEGKSSYSFICEYNQDESNDNDLYYGYNYISIIVPGQQIKNNSTYVSGIESKLILDINNTKTTDDNNTKIKENNTFKENRTNKNISTPINKNKKQNVKTLKNNQKKAIKEKIPVNYNIISLDEGFNITLSWLEELFNKTFDNKQLLIYIDDTLVYNGTVSSNSTETLFEIVKGYEGIHVLKVVEGENVYQRKFI